MYICIFTHCIHIHCVCIHTWLWGRPVELNIKYKPLHSGRTLQQLFKSLPSGKLLKYPEIKRKNPNKGRLSLSSPIEILTLFSDLMKNLSMESRTFICFPWSLNGTFIVKKKKSLDYEVIVYRTLYNRNMIFNFEGRIFKRIYSVFHWHFSGLWIAYFTKWNMICFSYDRNIVFFNWIKP